jgi:CBS-domain-containing membrane protein
MSQQGARALVVVDSADRPVSLVNESAVMALPEHRRPWVDVDAVARRLTPEATIAHDLEGESLLSAVGAARAPEMLVVDGDGLVVGVLAVTDVEQALTPARRSPGLR